MFVAIEKKLYKYVIISTLLFILLSILVKTNNTLVVSCDSAFEYVFNILQNPIVSTICAVISFFSSPEMLLFYIFVLVCILFNYRLVFPAIWVIYTLVITYLFGFLIKKIIYIARPENHLIGDRGSSYVSGHVLCLTAFVLILFTLIIQNMDSSVYKKSLKALLYIWIITVCVVRMYLLSVYLSDVIGAILLAISIVGVTTYFYKPISCLLRKHLRILRQFDY